MTAGINVTKSRKGSHNVTNIIMKPKVQYIILDYNDRITRL